MPGYAIHIERAVLTSANIEDGYGTFLINHKGAEIELRLPMAYAVVSEPDEWPPRAGDIWQAGGHHWFFYRDTVQLEPAILNIRNEEGLFVDGRAADQSATQWLLAKYGARALTLTYRVVS